MHRILVKMVDHALTQLNRMIEDSCVNALTDGLVIPAPMPLVFLRIETIYSINQTAL